MTAPVPALHSAWLGLGLILLLFLVLLVGIRFIQVRAGPGSETARKLFHLGGCSVAFLLPWFFDQLWPVLLLGGVSAAVFLALRIVPFLRHSVGQVLAAVKRTSLGEFWFIAAIVLLFWLSERVPLYFGVPLLVLAAADTSAALVGVTYGRIHYASTEGGQKSAEGSIAFFLVTFLSVHVPILLVTSAGRAESLLCSLDIAIVATMAEAIAWRGLDNVFIPFFSFVLLKSYLGMTQQLLLVHFATLIVFSLYAIMWRRRTNLAGNVLFGAVVYEYMILLLAGWSWILAPLLLFGGYYTLSKRVELDAMRHINFPILLPILLPSLLCAVLYWFLKDPALFFPFAATFGINISLIALVRHKHASPAAGWPGLILVNAAKGGVILLPPILVFAGFTTTAALHFGVGVAVILAATILFALVQPGMDSYPLDSPRWTRQCITVTVCSSLCLLPFVVPAGLAIAGAGRL